MLQILSHFYNYLIFDGFVKSPFCPIFVTSTKARIQLIQVVLSRHRRDCFRRSDSFSDFLRDHQFLIFILNFNKNSKCWICHSRTNFVQKCTDNRVLDLYGESFLMEASVGCYLGGLLAMWIQ